jgi:hypothetical protein
VEITTLRKELEELKIILANNLIAQLRLTKPPETPPADEPRNSNQTGRTSTYAEAASKPATQSPLLDSGTQHVTNRPPSRQAHLLATSLARGSRLTSAQIGDFKKKLTESIPPTGPSFVFTGIHSTKKGDIILIFPSKKDNCLFLRHSP